MAWRRHASARADILGEMGAWLREQKARAGELAHDVERAGRDAWDQARASAARFTGSSGDVAAAHLDRKAPPLSKRPPPPGAARGVPPNRPASVRSPFQEGIDQTLAGARGAQDALTLGLGDWVVAGGLAAADSTHGANFRRALDQRLAAERARDEYDARHYAAARTVGQATGTGIGLLAFGPANLARAAGVRMVEASPMVMREGAALAGLGGAGGAATQGLVDLERGRLGSVGDYVGAAAGGATGALASVRATPSQAAALGGATTSIVQDMLNRRDVDWRNAGQSALASRYVAALPGAAATAYADNLHFTDKGKLGEALGRMRTRLNGDKPLPGGRYYVESGGYTRPDHRTGSGLLTEQKFGPSARLSKNQRSAYNELKKRYRVDNWLNRDVGAIVAFPFGLLGRQMARDDNASP